MRIFFRLITAIFLFAAHTQLTAQNVKVPKFEPAICPACPYPDIDTNYLKKVNMSYGYLIVPENRKKSSGREIKLAVAIIKSRSSKPKEDPILFLHGGPGGQALGDVLHVHEVLRGDRDVILVDQRGSGLSQPDFSTSINNEFLSILARDLTADAEVHARKEIAERMHRQLIDRNIDLSAYNANEIAADMEDLRKCLGYKSCNLWGVSFGTRVALAMVHNFPEGVRSVILDSPLPENALYFQDINVNLKSALNNLFQKCASDPLCQMAYPHLENDFNEAMRSLVQSPLVLSMNNTDNSAHFPNGKFVLNTQDFLLALQQALYNRGLYPMIPVLIEAVKERREEIVAKFISNLANGIYSINYGLYYSVICNDCIPYNDIRRMDSSSFAFWGGLSYYKSDFLICDSWHSGKSDTAKLYPVNGRIPALILSGELDPMSNVSYGEMAGDAFVKNYKYVFDNTGHSVSLTAGDTVLNIMNQFLNNYDGQVPASQVIKTGKIKFITDIRMNAGIYDLAIRMNPVKGNTLFLIIAVTILLFFLTALFYYLRQLIKNRKQAAPAMMTEKLLATVTAVLAVGFIIGMVLFIMQAGKQDPLSLLFGLSKNASYILLIPYAVLILSLIQICLAAFSFFKKGQVFAFRVFNLLFLFVSTIFIIFTFSSQLIF